MIKKIAYLIILSLLGSTLIAAPIALDNSFMVNDASSKWKKGDLGSTTTVTEVDSNDSFGIYFHLQSETARVSKITLSGLVTAIDMDTELETLEDDQAFVKNIGNIRIENNTQDGFIVAVNAGGATSLHSNNNYTFTTESTDDGEVPIPYHLDFAYEPADPDDGEQVGEFTSSLPTGSHYGTVVVADSKVYNVIIHKSDMTMPLDGTLSIDLRVADAEQLKFAGSYKASNKFA
jgi:hypothetical protein